MRLQWQSGDSHHSPVIIHTQQTHTKFFVPTHACQPLPQKSLLHMGITSRCYIIARSCTISTQYGILTITVYIGRTLAFKLQTLKSFWASNTRWIQTSSKFSVSERMTLVVSSFWNISMVMVARQPQQCTKNCISSTMAVSEESW